MTLHTRVCSDYVLNVDKQGIHKKLLTNKINSIFNRTHRPTYIVLTYSRLHLALFSVTPCISTYGLLLVSWRLRNR